MICRHDSVYLQMGIGEGLLLVGLKARKALIFCSGYNCSQGCIARKRGCCRCEAGGLLLRPHGRDG